MPAVVRAVTMWVARSWSGCRWGCQVAGVPHWAVVSSRGPVGRGLATVRRTAGWVGASKVMGVTVRIGASVTWGPGNQPSSVQ